MGRAYHGAGEGEAAAVLSRYRWPDARCVHFVPAHPVRGAEVRRGRGAYQQVPPVASGRGLSACALVASQLLRLNQPFGA